VAAKQSSLERIFIVPFVLLLLCLASTVAWVIYRSADEAVDTISKMTLAKAAHYLHNSVQSHFSHARIALNGIMPYSISPQNSLPPASQLSSVFPELQDQLWTALHLFPEIGRRVFFCSKAGQYVGITKIKEHQYEVGLRGAGTEKWTVYSSTGPRQIGKAVRTESYDPRNQRWYRLALNHDSEVWYAHPFGDQGNENLLTLAKPVYAKNQTLQGVASAELSLGGITQMLNSIPVSQHGVAFIIDRSGKLIAASGTYLSSKEGPSKTAHFPAYASSRLVRDAHAAFKSGKADVAGAGRQVNAFEFTSGHEMAHAAAVDLRENGLDWVLIAAAPRSDFNEDVRQAVLRNLAMGLAAMMAALLLGFFTLRRALADIRRLTSAVKNIGRGESFTALNIERGDEIGQLAKSFQQIERSLRTDKLTSVLNRDSLIAQIDFHCSVGREVDFLRFTILFIDLDGFKQINDLYGHDEGDRVLSESAQRLQEAIRKEDAVARFGGDEFVVYLHGVGESSVIAAICEKISTSLEAPIHLRQGGMVQVGASIGHACFPEDGPNSDILLRVADNRMFYDKKMRKSTLQLPLE
jgi:diguanylate cyclase